MKIQTKIVLTEEEKAKAISLARQLEDIDLCDLLSCQCSTCLQEACPLSQITSNLWAIADKIITLAKGE
jgi:hypothetical protein